MCMKKADPKASVCITNGYGKLRQCVIGAANGIGRNNGIHALALVQVILGVVDSRACIVEDGEEYTASLHLFGHLIVGLCHGVGIDKSCSEALVEELLCL